MHKIFTLAVMLCLVPLAPALASPQQTGGSYLHIVEPQGGLYYHGQKLLPGDPFWTVIVGDRQMAVRAEGSDNVLTVYFTLYDVQEREVIDQQLDATPGDGFACLFSNVPRGTYLVIALGLAADLEEPVASDWRTPILFIPT
ncbi:MAG TPA: hypothetical protein ENN54_05070 [Thermoplasmatales archaeon]|nr:hypothetical protein [Thermoplasmatales archaeon]